MDIIITEGAGGADESRMIRVTLPHSSVSKKMKQANRQKALVMMILKLDKATMGSIHNLMIIKGGTRLQQKQISEIDDNELETSTVIQ